MKIAPSEQIAVGGTLSLSHRAAVAVAQSSILGKPGGRFLPFRHSDLLEPLSPPTAWAHLRRGMCFLLFVPSQTYSPRALFILLPYIARGNLPCRTFGDSDTGAFSLHLQWALLTDASRCLAAVKYPWAAWNASCDRALRKTGASSHSSAVRQVTLRPLPSTPTLPGRFFRHSPEQEHSFLRWVRFLGLNVYLHS